MLRVSHFTNGVAPPAGKYRSPPACKVGDLFSVWPSSASRRGCSAAGRPVRNSVCEADEVVAAAAVAEDAAVDDDDDGGGDAVDCAGPPLSISNKHEIVNSSEYGDLLSLGFRNSNDVHLTDMSNKYYSVCLNTADHRRRTVQVGVRVRVRARVMVR